MVARNKLVINGTLGFAAQEAFSCSIHYGPGPNGLVANPTDLSEWADSVMGAISTGPGNVLLAMDDSARITGVTAYVYGGSGPALAAGASTAAPIEGEGGAADLPPQCALVVSLLTGFVGASRRGRFYWPATGCTIGSSYTLTTPTTAQIASEFATLLDNFGVGGGGVTGLQPVVYSQVLDTLTPVLSVSVGNVIDTQRRRRDNLVETYSTYPIT
uniref:Uncharacterized protein n=1 Tax=uncultured prokaryote TaxID=198431 RepID=A0A0H5Q3Z0_9ZZZZ|nr:hypothetical protein [uncultured prokaryote]